MVRKTYLLFALARSRGASCIHGNIIAALVCGKDLCSPYLQCINIRIFGKVCNFQMTYLPLQVHER